MIINIIRYADKLGSNRFSEYLIELNEKSGAERRF